MRGWRGARHRGLCPGLGRPQPTSGRQHEPGPKGNYGPNCTGGDPFCEFNTRTIPTVRGRRMPFAVLKGTLHRLFGHHFAPGATPSRSRPSSTGNG
eukprot:7593489-Lingulodinium_polyedra.AAC.1